MVFLLITVLVHCYLEIVVFFPCLSCCVQIREIVVFFPCLSCCVQISFNTMNIRVSYHDMVMFLAILNSVPGQALQAAQRSSATSAAATTTTTTTDATTTDASTKSMMVPAVVLGVQDTEASSASGQMPKTLGR